MEDGRVAFLDFGMTKRLDIEQIELEQIAVDAAARKDPEGAAAWRSPTSASSRIRRSSTPNG